MVSLLITIKNKLHGPKKIQGGTGFYALGAGGLLGHQPYPTEQGGKVPPRHAL
jgi:hypothetical protein